MAYIKLNLIRLSIVVLGLLLLPPASRAHADATVYWSLDYDGFQPRTLIIGPGEVVTWYNVDIYNIDTHVYFDAGLNFSLPNFSYQPVTFNVGAGVYGYQDHIGDTATVIVNIAPTVTITSPADNTAFPAPATFTLSATGSDTADDYVSDIAFYLGTSDSTNLVEDVFSAPFTTGITNLDAGNYTLIAIATDSRGWTSTNAITITVGAAAAMQLSSPRFAANNFLFDASGLTIGKTNIVQVSTNLVSWIPAKTNIASSASLTITNATTQARQFYRVLQLP